MSYISSSGNPTPADEYSPNAPIVQVEGINNQQNPIEQDSLLTSKSSSSSSNKSSFPHTLLPFNPATTISNTASHQHQQEQEMLSGFAIPNPPISTQQSSVIAADKDSIDSNHLQSSNQNNSQIDSPRTLWMGDLDPWLDENGIADLWWTILNKKVSVKIIKPRISKPDMDYLGLSHSGYCFVEFESFDDAQQALSLNGKLLPDIAMPSQQQFPKNPDNQKKYFRLNWASGATLTAPIIQTPEYSLFVGDLSASTTEAHLLAFFQKKFPTSIKTVRVMTDPVSGKSRCFGFVRFTDELERQKALIEMNGAWFGGRPLRVALATPRNNSNQNNNLQNHSQFQNQNQNHHSHHPNGHFRNHTPNSLTPGNPSQGIFSPNNRNNPNFYNDPNQSDLMFLPSHSAHPPPPHPPSALANSPYGFYGTPVLQPPPFDNNLIGNANTPPPPISNIGSNYAGRPSSSSDVPNHSNDNPTKNNPTNNEFAGYPPGAIPGLIGIPNSIDQFGGGPVNPLITGGTNGANVEFNNRPNLNHNFSPNLRTLQGNSQGQPFTDPKNTTVFVGGLSSEVSEQTLFTLFKPFGLIQQVKIPPGKNCGFIKYDTREEAEEAIGAMQGFIIGGNRIRLSWGRVSMNNKKYQQQQQQVAQAAQIQAAAALSMGMDPASAIAAAAAAAAGGYPPPPPPPHATGIPPGMPPHQKYGGIPPPPPQALGIPPPPIQGAMGSPYLNQGSGTPPPYMRGQHRGSGSGSGSGSGVETNEEDLTTPFDTKISGSPKMPPMDPYFYGHPPPPPGINDYNYYGGPIGFNHPQAPDQQQDRPQETSNPEDLVESMTTLHLDEAKQEGSREGQEIEASKEVSNALPNRGPGPPGMFAPPMYNGGFPMQDYSYMTHVPNEYLYQAGFNGPPPPFAPTQQPVAEEQDKEEKAQEKPEEEEPKSKESGVDVKKN